MSETEVVTDQQDDVVDETATDEPVASDELEAEDGADSDDVEGGDRNSLLIQEGDIAADYLERLLDIVDYDGDIDLDVENGRAVVAIVGSGLRSLVGTRGETLEALQELTRLAVAQKTGTRSRLMLDVSGHRAERRNDLTSLANDTAARVLETGDPARLTPMNPFERKVVHDAITAIDGVRSESEGEEPNRRVVVLPG
ncbi:R3H domain-containing nucleic acid-binding protein [Jatrophihabitans sp.]|uniref:Jag family protein n=1 Tax=Jatrophihabitans sp. TaxID=1932789 RepID=UPI0030C730DF|nr:single-stranded nucleic acid binding domain protein [Jatrophihabitans sp.]